MTKVKDTKATLRLKLQHMQAQLAHTYHFADAALGKTSQKHFMASGVVLQLTANNGKEVIPPVMIKDGLSDETIAAIRADLARSYSLAIMFKPSGVTQ
jgi:hypothetical protein